MGRVLHGSATTTEAVRRAIQRSQESLRTLASRYGIRPCPGHENTSNEASGVSTKPGQLQSLTLAVREVPVPVGLRLFLPSTWTEDPPRCAKAGVPEAARVAQSKLQIALTEIDRLMAAGVRFGCVLADAGYGSGAPFRQGLRSRGLTWAVGVPAQ